jgi:signal transduction histidine kinase
VTLTVEGTHLDGAWDRLRLEQVVANLVTNAIKYGGGTPVRALVRPNGERVQIVVEDRGPGIADADRERIFGRFERAASIRHFGGLGLGLYISRQIAIAHGGDVRVESNPGGGSRFIVEVPRTTTERPSTITA